MIYDIAQEKGERLIISGEMDVMHSLVGGMLRGSEHAPTQNPGTLLGASIGTGILVLRHR